MVRFCIVTVAAYVLLSVFAVLTLGVRPLPEHSSAPLGFLPSSPPVVSDQRLEKGKFLVAANHLNGSDFSQTVIYLVAYSQRGALGVVVNRPTDIQLARALPHLADQPHAEDVIYAGGPVGRAQMLLLVRSQTFSRGEMLPITAEVSVTSSPDNLTRLAATATAQFHVYAGYAGWSARQLDSEVARGDWHVMPADPTTLFDTDLKDVWSALKKKDSRGTAEWIHARPPLYPKSPRASY